jgi:hypothetical protein
LRKPFSIYLELIKNNQLKTTNKMKKSNSTKDQIKVDKGIHRDIMLEMGMYNIHKEKVYRDKKTYSRKAKHKKGYE